LCVVTSVAASSLADLRSSATANACCVKANYQCAGLSEPDDCCKRMGHTAAAGVAGTLSAAQPLVLPATIVATFLPIDVRAARDSSRPDCAFKRPHDPPHLHPFSLLI
jgi:hypothetical protein